MEFTNYLSFIQVAIAFNFGSVYWREKEKKDNSERGCVDAIAQMYRNETLKNPELKDKSDRWIADINEMKDKLSVGDYSEQEKMSFYSICDKHQKKCTQMLNLNNRIGEYSCSVCFGCVCLFLGLYGLLQLCLIPDVGHPGFSQNVYMFFTEILLYMMGIFLFVDIYCWVKWVEKDDYYYKTTIGVFGGLLAIVCVCAWLAQMGILKLGTLPCSDETFIYLSIYLTYSSYIVYFFLNLMEYWREFYLAKLKIPKMNKECDSLVHDMKKICEK